MSTTERYDSENYRGTTDLLCHYRSSTVCLGSHDRSRTSKGGRIDLINVERSVPETQKTGNIRDKGHEVCGKGDRVRIR